MELTNEQKQAIEYGVPMRETCEQMNWQGQTFFFWLKSISGKWYLVNKAKKPFSNIICYREANILQIENSLILDWVMVVPAPQMHNIANVLPLKLFYITTEAEFCHNNDTLYYDGFDYLFETRINDFHFAQAYAELYIRLKNEGLLK